MHTREKILAGARRYLMKHGHVGFTVRAVAAEAGVNAGLVHHYYGSKDNLILALLESESSEMLTKARRLRNELSPQGMREALVSGFFSNIVVAGLFVEAIILAEKSDAIKVKLGEIIRSRREYFTDLAGITDPEEKVMLQAVIFGLQLLRKVNPEVDVEKTVTRFFSRYVGENSS